MTVEKLLWLNNPEEILWLGSNLLSHEQQVDSQITASVQNSLSLQEIRLGWIFCWGLHPQGFVPHQVLEDHFNKKSVSLS